MKRIWHAFYDKDVPKTITEPIPLPNELFRRNAKTCPKKPFLIYFDQELSYSECNLLSCKIANGLLNLGVEKKDRVTLMMPNIPQYPLVLLACYKIGAIAVPTNPQFTVYELTNQLKDSGTHTVVVAAAYAHKVVQIRDSGITMVKKIIVVPDSCSGDMQISFPDIINYDLLLEQSRDEEPDIRVSPDDIAVLQYSGGTTGNS